ncbi:hypothetical protein NW072_04400 [Mycoplasmopsis felis]|uniref:hypothetical protein n=1 Tax=Mycoplasmopsis felis TaxID=33923 RepID=UPI0021AEA31C|nr:hypothetical protein [Mycoplasmopsis felis]UWV79273.1 hypothetical protein NW072_04400 [Mycoplasmopsis felis]
MERNLRPENNRYLYLTFNELKSFEFKHLTEGMNWVLHKVEIVNKHNLQTVLDIPLNNVSKRGLETLTTKLEVNNLTLNSGSQIISQTLIINPILLIIILLNKN